MRLLRTLLVVGVLGAGLATGSAPASAEGRSVPPERILDTRAGVGAPARALAPGEVLTLPVSAARTADADAVMLNLTATEARDAGYVTAWPCGQAAPATSVVNFDSGVTVANAVAVGAGDDGVCLAASAPVHLVADLMGWFSGEDFRPIRPHRLLDTRVTNDRFARREERRLRVTGAHDIPGEAGGVALNVTVVGPDADGYLTVYPCGSRPEASTVNFRSGDVVPNLTLVPLAGGEVCIFASVAADVVIDAFGWSSNRGDVRLQSPTRLLDTRTGLGGSSGAAGPSQPVALRVAGRGGVPNDAAAALLTVTATGGRADGFVTTWPCDLPRPTTSVLNLQPGLLRSNLALVPLARAEGTVCLFAWTVDGTPVDLVVDAVGIVGRGPDRTPPPPEAPPPSPPPPPPTAPPPSGYFATLPVGAALPGDAECAARVRDAGEIRPGNTVFNQTSGSGRPVNPPPGVYSRVTGAFTGTTDEIIQWAACKWGIDEDIVRAQTAKESWWDQKALGDGGESYGLMQVRQPYWGWAFPSSRTSSAYNMDVALAARRNCFEGYDTWLNQFERGEDYRAGDLWGCVGLWFAGRWKTGPANTYTAEVQQYLAQRIWQTAAFINHPT